MPNKAKKPSAPIRLMIVTGIFVAFFIAFLVYLSGVKPNVPSDLGNQNIDSQKKTQVNQEQDFEFYQLLQQPSVKKSKNSNQTAQSALTTPKSSSLTSSSLDKQNKGLENDGVNTQSQYLLQVGSFRSQTDADALRAQMILMGFSTQIKPIRLGDGQLWYRTVIGPFDQNDLAGAKQQLSVLNIQPLTVKIP